MLDELIDDEIVIVGPRPDDEHLDDDDLDDDSTVMAWTARQIETAVLVAAGEFVAPFVPSAQFRSTRYSPRDD